MGNLMISKKDYKGSNKLKSKLWDNFASKSQKYPVITHFHIQNRATCKIGIASAPSWPMNLLHICDRKYKIWRNKG
mgnify:CR=1 FL=1